MTGGRGLFTILIGLLLAVFADFIGRHHAEMRKTPRRKEQLFVFSIGVLIILYGIFLLIFS